jgi:kynurenine formamidase
LNIIDLSQELDENTHVFPGSPNLKVLQWSNYAIHGYYSETIFTSTHIGTHMDAPSHFNPDGISVEKIPLEKIVVLDKAKVLRIKKDDDAKIEPNDLKEFDIVQNDTLLIYTGWSLNRQKDKYFKNNPGLSKRGAEYLADLKINLIGIDSPSIDPAFDKEFNAHRVFSIKNIPIIENLINLDKINQDSFTFIALPLKLKYSSGSPVRAIALIN